MNVFSEIRRRIDEASTRKALRHLDNHLLRDIGLPERNQMSSFHRF